MKAGRRGGKEVGVTSSSEGSIHLSTCGSSHSSEQLLSGE